MRDVFTAKALTKIVAIGACVGVAAGSISAALGIPFEFVVPLAAGATGVVTAIIVNGGASNAE